MDNEGAIIPSNNDGLREGGLPPRDNTDRPETTSALRFALEQKNRFHVSAKQHISQAMNLLDSLPKTAEDMISADIPLLLREGGSEIPDIAREHIAQLDELKQQTHIDGVDIQVAYQVHETDRKLNEYYKAQQDLEQVKPSDIGAATRKIELQKLKAQIEAEYAILDGLRAATPNLDSYRLSEAIQERENTIHHLNSQIIADCVNNTVGKIGNDRSRFTEALAENPDSNDEVFNHALGVVRPKVDLLVDQGYLAPTEAEEYISLITQQHDRAKTEAPDEPVLAQVAQRIGYLVFKTPGLVAINQIVKGVEDKAYKDIFGVMAMQEIQPFLQEVKQKIKEMNLGWVRYEFDQALANILPESDFLLYSSLSGEALMSWENIRSSNLAKVFTSDRWTNLEQRLVPHLYDGIMSNFVPSKTNGSYERTIHHVVSFTNGNRQLLRPYLPRLINGVAAVGYSKEAAPAMYTLLTQLSPADMQYLEQNGFSVIAQLKRLVESNSLSFARMYFTDPQEPQNWKKFTRNPVYQEVGRTTGLLALKMLEDANIEDREMERALKNLRSSWRDVHEGYGQDEPLWQDVERFSREDSDWMLIDLRQNDRMLTHVAQQRRFPTAETREQFFQAVNVLKERIHQPDIPEDKKAFLISNPVLFLLARQPHKFDAAVEIILHNANFEKLAALMTPDGPLAVGVDGTLHEIFSSGNPAEMIEEILEGFSSNKPYWKFLFDTTRRIYGEQMRNIRSDYPISEVPVKDGVLSVAELVERHRGQKQVGTTPSLLEEMIDDDKIIEQLTAGALSDIPLGSFHGMYRERIFGEYLRKAVMMSRDAQLKQQADVRNRAGVKQVLIPGELYIHATAIDVLDPVLMNGNLPKQVFCSDELANKNWPFHTDFIRFDQVEGKSQSIKNAILSHERIGEYGATDARTVGSLGPDGQIFFVYDRNNPQVYEAGKDYEPKVDAEYDKTDWENHRIIPGGMPSTEISAIILRNPVATFNKALNAISENGFYIPIYDFDGNLLVAPEQFDAYRKELNCDIAVPVWEYTSKVGDAKGSHTPAGEYILPSQDNPRRYYVKFAKFDFGYDLQAPEKEQEEKNRIWNEFLADRIYGHLGIPVPETSLVRVNRTYGHASEEKIADARTYAHASEILSTDAAQQEVIRQRLKNGFIVDALLANWDIAKVGNVVASNGEVYRIDNGGALLFRAQGVRKTADEFGDTVTELISMRDGYPSLEESDIQQQLAVLREKFQDGDIDNLVDSVRLNQTDRNLLRTRLRNRRDYIWNYFNFRAA